MLNKLFIRSRYSRSKAENPRYLISTSQKTIRILKALHEHGRAGVKELARAIDMNRSTVHNHLSTLQSEHMIFKHDGEYARGLRMLEFGGEARSDRQLYTVARDEIERLATQTGDVAGLVVEEHGETVYLEYQESDNTIDIDVYPGVRRALHVTAAGKAILAHLSTERIDEIVASQGLPAKTSQSITNKKELFADLESVRDRGFAIDEEKHINRLWCIGAPIQTITGDVLGVVSVSTPITLMNDDAFYGEIPNAVRSATNVIELNPLHLVWRHVTVVQSRWSVLYRSLDWNSILRNCCCPYQKNLQGTTIILLAYINEVIPYDSISRRYRRRCHWDRYRP